jgi:hypothetical protein
LVVGNANANVVVYRSLEAGKKLEEMYRFVADFAGKDATIVLHFSFRIRYVFRKRAV